MAIRTWAHAPCRTPIAQRTRLFEIRRGEVADNLESSRLYGVKRNWIIAIVAIGAVTVSTLIVLVGGGEATSTGSSPMQYALVSAYAPLPTGLTVGGDFSFGPLRNSQLAAVRVTAPRAIQIATRAAGVRSGPTSSGSTVTVSLGRFINDQEIITDWVGTKSFIPKAIPAYVVKISGLHIESLGPGGAVNHEYDVVVNASNGDVIETFSYR